MFDFKWREKKNQTNPNQIWYWSQWLLLKDKALCSSNCNFPLLIIMGEKKRKKALNSSMAFSDMMWVAVQLKENGDHVCGSYTCVLFGFPKENQMKSKKDALAWSPRRSSLSAVGKVFISKSTNMCQISWCCLETVAKTHELLQSKNRSSFGIQISC